MTAAPPRLSVLMTVYNGGRFLAAAVDSVLSSPFRDLELVVVDNVSTDGSREWLRAVADPRLRLIENETNLGQTGALRRGLEACSADIVARLDADDVSEPDRFGMQVRALDEDGKLALVGGQTLTIDPEDRILSQSRLPSRPDEIAAVMCVANPFIHSAVAFRRPAALAVGGYDTEFAIAQDFALWSGLLRAGHSLRNLEVPVCRLRLHPGQVTASGLRLREAPESLRITAANQAWALAREAEDMPAARQIQALWLGNDEPGDVAPALRRLLASPRFSPAGRARLALLMAAGQMRGRAALRAWLVAQAAMSNPLSVLSREPLKAVMRLLRPKAAPASR